MKKILKKISFIITGIFVFYSLTAQETPGDFKSELSNYETQIEKYKTEQNAQLELEYLNKAAFLCWNNQLHTKAINYFERVVSLNDKLGNENGTLLATNYIGMIYDDLQNYSEAISYFNKGLEISRKQENKKNIISALLNVSQTYQQLQDYEKSNNIALEGVNLAKELNNLKLVRTFYGILANNYQDQGNSEKSIEYFDQFASIDKFLKTQEIKDIKQESEKQVNQANVSKQNTEKELLIQTDRLRVTEDSLAQVEELTREQKMQLELKESKIREQGAQLKFERLLRSFLIGGFIIFLIFFLILASLYRKIKSQKLQIEMQRDTLEMQNKHINASIQYAQNIQQAILPAKEQLDSIFENFIIYKPKDIVSGDFYWITKTENLLFAAAVDCTGHGVPGAFMSMIGNSLLNEIVLEKKIKDPAKILSLLNKKVVEALRQNETDNSDGMDVCLVSIELTKKEIVFAGAKRPLYIYSSRKNELDEIKGDRISIGGVKKRDLINDEFINHVIQAEKGDIIYLSSDGFTDQNNNERKRFGSNRLKNVFLGNISLPMIKQKEVIETELSKFQQDEYQRDDITLIGLKFN